VLANYGVKKFGFFLSVLLIQYWEERTLSVYSIASRNLLWSHVRPLTLWMYRPVVDRCSCSCSSDFPDLNIGEAGAGKGEVIRKMRMKWDFHHVTQ